MVDGTTLVVADSPDNTSRYTKHRCTNGSSGYPQMRLSALYPTDQPISRDPDHASAEDSD